MPAPNLFIVYVSDIARAAEFYSDLFEMAPRFTSPRFVEFDVAPGVGLALWTGHAENLESAEGHRGEICVNVENAPQSIEDYYRRWEEKGVTIVHKPYDDIFGRTFVAQDPDGNLLRVAPVDPS